MRKQDVWLVVFVILALGISLAVYFASREERRNLRLSKNKRALVEMAKRPLDHNRPGNTAVVPANPVSPNEDLQRTMQTLKDIQRINKMNADNQLRRQQTPSSAPSPKK